MDHGAIIAGIDKKYNPQSDAIKNNTISYVYLENILIIINKVLEKNMCKTHSLNLYPFVKNPKLMYD